MATDANGMNSRDANQVIRTVAEEQADGGLAFKVTPVSGSLVSEAYDYQAFTYVTVGNGIGQIQTVTYKFGGAGGTTVAVVTMTYDSSDRIATVTRT